MNAQQLANLALKFLLRSTLSPHERSEFAMVEQMLVKVAKGELTIGTPPEPEKAKGGKK